MQAGVGPLATENTRRKGQHRRTTQTLGLLWKVSPKLKTFWVLTYANSLFKNITPLKAHRVPCFALQRHKSLTLLDHNRQALREKKNGPAEKRGGGGGDEILAKARLSPEHRQPAQGWSQRSEKRELVVKEGKERASTTILAQRG